MQSEYSGGMRLPITPVNTLLRDLRGQLRQNHPGGRLLVAVDALPSVATAAFADAFADVVAEDGTAVFRAGADGFLLPPRARPCSRCLPIFARNMPVARPSQTPSPQPTAPLKKATSMPDSKPCKESGAPTGTLTS